MAIAGTEGVVLLVGRLLFGGVLAFMGLNHFLDREQMAGYAAAKGLPAPELAVVASGAALVLGGLAIVVGAYPLVGAAAVAAFLLVSAVTVHDFWAVPEDQQQEELTQFLKNVSLAGGALIVAAAAGEAWSLSVGVGLL